MIPRQRNVAWGRGFREGDLRRERGETGRRAGFKIQFRMSVGSIPTARTIHAVACLGPIPASPVIAVKMNEAAIRSLAAAQLLGLFYNRAQRSEQEER